MTNAIFGGIADFIISTHILTKRMTIIENQIIELSDISTHILTKRMTFYLIGCINEHKNFNSHPHEEDDRWYVDWW